MQFGRAAALRYVRQKPSYRARLLPRWTGNVKSFGWCRIMAGAVGRQIQALLAFARLLARSKSRLRTVGSLIR
jgi:hypothetical protein